MPESMKNGFANQFKRQIYHNEEIFIRKNQEEVDIILEENLLGDDGQEALDFEKYERNRKALAARKKAELQS